MNVDLVSGRRSVSPTSSGRSSPVPHASRRAVEDGLYRADKGLRRYAALIERALSSWEVSPQEWADYIAFLGRLLKAIQALAKPAPFLPHSAAVASKLFQCLNPALPSGVHQKALEVYAYIFSAFGPDHLSAHLQEYLPGLSSVLSFASLSVRPGLYVLFENHIVALSSTDLRPALKSLILGLLPAIEEETAEDFDRAFKILQSLERKFAADGGSPSARKERSGYFWQCLFLCVITSPSRRLGALNFLTRKLPRFSGTHGRGHGVNGSTDGDASGLSVEAEAAISPESGLLVRCFIAGLCDPQVLVQRGFLDLLVTHLPLDSLVLRDRIDADDLDRLVNATLQVLLRREMSLNRRLWAWFLRSDPKDSTADGQTPLSPDLERNKIDAPRLLSGPQYFEAYGKASLTQCVLRMFRADAVSAAQKARPFRICLSLMDRWEIGGSLIPPVLLPAMESAHDYSLSAPSEAEAELLRSASLFFDGIEATLIWACMNSLLRDGLTNDPEGMDRLRLFRWIVSNFNIKDEDMLTVHIPMTALYLLSVLDAESSSILPSENRRLAVEILTLLIDAIPSRAFERTSEAAQPTRHPATVESDWPRNSIITTVIDFYKDAGEASGTPSMPFEPSTLKTLLQNLTASVAIRALAEQSNELFCQAVSLMLTLIPKAAHVLVWKPHDLQQAIMATLSSAERGLTAVPFPVVASIVTLSSSLRSSGQVTAADIVKFESPLVWSLWQNFSPNAPKYHVEAARCFWLLEDLVAPDDAIKVSLLALTRPTQASSGGCTGEVEESIRRFATLWSHSMPSQPSTNMPGAFGLPRRGSAMATVADAAQSVRRKETLQVPLLLILDQLRDTSYVGFEAVKTWLSNLSSLEHVFAILLERLATFATPDSLSHPDHHVEERLIQGRKRSIEDCLTHLKNLLSHGNDWTWQSLRTTLVKAAPVGDNINGVLFLARCSADVLNDRAYDSTTLHRTAMGVLEVLLTGPAALELKRMELDALLIDRLIRCLTDGDDALQGLLLRLIMDAIRLRLTQTSPDQARATRPRGSIGAKSSSMPIENATASSTLLATATSPPPQLLQCICLGFTSHSARFHTEQWLDFLASVLPTFADAIFANLLPLVECFCRELNKTFGDLTALSRVGVAPTVQVSESLILALLEGLEMVLARGHECLIAETMADPAPRPMAQPNNFLGNVASGVFKAEGSPSKTSQANSRLTVILAFQDAIRLCLEMWDWSSHHSDNFDLDRSSAATIAYCSLRLRNKTRHLLEQMFAVEPLESLEVVIARWSHAPQKGKAAAAISLLQVMQGTRPKNVVPAVLDALCSRANAPAISAARQSTQTTDLTALDVALFLSAYIKSTEDDAMDEVWSDCIVFLRDVLANPLPYRQVLPALLSTTMLLAEKLGNTNYGEQRKMRRELGDIFVRLLAATLTTLPSGFGYEALSGQQLNDSTTREERSDRSSPNLFVVLKHVVANLEIVLESSERTSTAVNSIVTSVIGPLIYAKSFPRNTSSDALDLLLECARKAPSSKLWKKEVSDAFNDPRLLMSQAKLMEDHWFPLFFQWCLRDKDRVPEQLSRLTPPSSAGIMFGVGASAARLEADRKTQLVIRRICILLLASPEDTFADHLKDFEEKLVELFEATHSSSPSAAMKAELFLLCRALMLSLSSVHLSPLWPVVNENLHAALTSLLSTTSTSNDGFTNLGLLQACKLLDHLITVSPDEFQLHEWLYITDTIDAVYGQADGSPHSLADQVAEALGSDAVEDSQPILSTGAPGSMSGSEGQRRALLDSTLPVDKEDLKALPRNDFAKMVVRPFLSQLSICAYEGVYSMESADTRVCRRDLLNDILDLSTIIE